MFKDQGRRKPKSCDESQQFYGNVKESPQKNINN